MQISIYKVCSIIILKENNYYIYYLITYNITVIYYAIFNSVSYTKFSTKNTVKIFYLYWLVKDVWIWLLAYWSIWDLVDVNKIEHINFNSEMQQFLCISW